MAANENAEKPKKRNKVKEIWSELKKVTWPTFGKVVKQTCTVLVVTIFFLIVLLAMDQLLSLAYNQLTKGLGTTTPPATGALANLAGFGDVVKTFTCGYPLF